MRKQFLILAFALSFAGSGLAQPFTLDWFKIAGGGGISAAGKYSVSGTLGQPDAGALAGSAYSLYGGFWSDFAMATLSAPALYLVRADGNIVLYWPASALGYGLEQNQELVASNSWSAVAPAPFQQNGFNYVTNPVAAGIRFYRLRHP